MGRGDPWGINSFWRANPQASDLRGREPTVRRFRGESYIPIQPDLRCYISSRYTFTGLQRILAPCAISLLCNCLISQGPVIYRITTREIFVSRQHCLYTTYSGIGSLDTTCIARYSFDNFPLSHRMGSAEPTVPTSPKKFLITSSRE